MSNDDAKTEVDEQKSGTTNRVVTYEDIALNCFRYLGFRSFAEVDELYINEYELLMKAMRLKRVDREYEIHLSAYMNQVAKSTRKVSKTESRPLYANFNDFFNYEERVNSALGIKPKPKVSSKVIDILQRANNH